MPSIRGPLCALLLLTGPAASSAVAAAPTNDALYESAQQSFNEGRYEEARTALLRLLEQRRHEALEPQARLLLFQSNIYLGRLDEAEALLARLQQERGDETREDLLFWQAEIARKRGRHARARALYQQVLTENPQSALAPLARYSLGLAWYEEGRFAEALEVFEPLVEEARTADVERDTRFMLGLTHYRLRQYEETVRYLRALLAEAPDFRQAAAARYYLGEAYYYLNDWLAAQQAYAASLAADAQGPLAPYASYGLGWAWYQLKRPREARAALERFVQAHPDDPLADSARYAAADCARQRGDAEAARRWFDEILAHADGPNAPHDWLDEAWLGKGELLTAEGDRAGAIALYEEAVRRLQDHAQRSAVRRRLADLLMQEGRLEESQRAWTLAAQETVEPEWQRWAWLRAGDAAQARRRWTEARADYARAGGGEEGALYANYLALQQARLLHAQGRQPEAIAALQEWLVQHPRADEADAAVAELAQTYADLGQYEASATQWQTLITQYPRSPLVPQAYLAWGTLLMDRQRWMEAAERFQALLRFFPEHPLAQQAVLLRTQSLQLLGRPAEAQRAMREYLDRPLPPETAIPLWIWLGRIEAQQARWDDARDAWQTVADRWPAHALTAQALYALAEAARQTGRPQDAETLWRRVVDAFPGNPWAVQARLALAEAAARGPDPEAARRWLAPVVEDFASRAEDRAAVGDFWRKRGAWAEARLAYTPRAADAPDDAARLLWLSGICDEEAGNLTAAIARYQELDQRYGETTWAAQGRLALGQALERQEQREAARALYQRVIAQYPDEARYAQERLDALAARPTLRGAR